MVYDSVYEANKYFRLPVIPATAVTEETLDSTNGTASWNVDNGGSDITIDTGNNEIDITGTGQKSGYYDLGASVSASAWVLRFKIASSGSPSGNPLFWVGMFDVNTIDSRNTNVDGISLMMYTGSTYKLSMKNGSHMDSGGSQTNTSPTVSADTTTRYVEIVRNGSNAVLTFYDSDTYTTSIGTCTVAITGTSFRYLCAISYFEGSGRTYSLSNVKLYNGVTSVEPAHPDVRKQHFWEYFSGSKLQEASVTDEVTGGTTDAGFNSNLKGFGNKVQTGDTLVGKKITKLSIELKNNGSGVGGNITLGVFNTTSSTPVFTFGTFSASTLTSSYQYFEQENLTGHTLVADQVLGFIASGDISNLKLRRYNGGTGGRPTLYGMYHAVSSGSNWQNAGDAQDINMKVGYAGGTRWTERNGLSGDGTVSTSYAVMADEVNGGVKISSNTGTWGKTTLSFNGKRQFDATASVMIFNGRRTGHSVGYNITGLSDHVLIWDNAPQEVGIKNYSEDSSYKLITSDGTQQSETDFNPTVAIDTNFHNFQIVNTSTSNSGYIDGVLGLSKTTNRPTGKGTTTNVGYDKIC